MATVKFVSLDESARTVTFDIDGESVECSIPKTFEGTTDEYIEALATGLVIEYTETEIKSLDDVTYSTDEIIISTEK